MFKQFKHKNLQFSLVVNTITHQIIIALGLNLYHGCISRVSWLSSKIGQGHPSSNLAKSLLRYIHSISLGPMRLISVKLSCLQAKVQIGQGHPSLNLTKTLLRYIHGISLGPMRLLFVELSCLQAKIANFHV